MTDRSNPLQHAAYGGPGWQPRSKPLSAEIGTIWNRCGINSEYGRLKSVLLHRPGREILTDDVNAAQQLAALDLNRARAQHDALAAAYQAAGVEVHYVELSQSPTPNQMFMADLFTLTPEGAILARPASDVRAGEERVAALNLLAMGVPIVRSVSGSGTFEGADMLWLSPKHVILGRGLRTNAEAIRQITDTLDAMDVKVTKVDLPAGSMHLMGMMRIVDRDLAIAWPSRIAWAAVEALQAEGYAVHYLPDLAEPLEKFSFNFVTIGPREIMMAADSPVTQTFYESLGIRCHVVAVDELGKAAGAIGCLTGVVERELL